MPIPVLAPVLAAVFAGFSRLFTTKLGGWVATAMMALGLHFVVTGTLIEAATDMVSSAMGGIPGSVRAWLGVLNFGAYVSIILSAYTAGGIKRAVLARRGA